MRPAIALLMSARRTIAPGLTIFDSNFNFTNTNVNVGNALNNVPAGALLVFLGAGGDDSGAFTNGSIISSPSLIWTQQLHSSASSNGDAEVWTAVFAAGGNITTSYTGSSSDSTSATLIALTGQETVLGGASNSAVNQSLPSVDVTTTRAGSILFCVTSDWGAADPGTRAYRDNAVEFGSAFKSGAYTSYFYYKLAPGIASYTEGLTAPSMTSNAGTCVYEVRSP